MRKIMDTLANPSFYHLKPYVPGKPISETERELGIKGVIKLASNENPLGPSPKAVAAMKNSLNEMHDYPDGGCFYFKQAIAQFHKDHEVGLNQIICGNGTNELLEMMIRTFVREGENIIYQQGSFIVYKLCTISAGRQIKEVPLKNYAYDLKAILESIDKNTKMIFIANPNNPTGTMILKEEWEAFMKAVPEHVLIVYDEAYTQYAKSNPNYPNGLDYIRTRKRYLVTRTFSKCYGLAGVRIGYAMGSEELIDFINRGRQPFNVNKLAQIAGIAALQDSEHVENSVQLNNSELPQMTKFFKDRGYAVPESYANFILVDFKEHYGSGEKDLFQKLLHKGVIVRPMAGYGLPTCARITIGTPEQNARLYSAFNEISADFNAYEV